MGKTELELTKRLDELFTRLNEKNLKFNLEKCLFNKEKLRWLGMKIDTNGVAPDDRKLKEISMLAKPEDKKTLRSFLGAVNYCSRFIFKYSSIAGPLYEMLRKNENFVWNDRRTTAFESLKNSWEKKIKLAIFESEGGKIRVKTDA